MLTPQQLPLRLVFEKLEERLLQAVFARQ